jgi:ATP-dependent Lhr-like helicase
VHQLPDDTISSPRLGAAWFAQRGWSPFPFQEDVWNAVERGESGLLHATTGSGKTYAVWLAALNSFAKGKRLTAKGEPSKRKQAAEPLSVLWLTPMRALAADTKRALEAPVDDLELNWTIGLRTGDTSSAERARQSRRQPTALVTTPESLSLMLSREDSQEIFSSLRMIVVDEWHELLGNKRGTQVQLALARLRQWNPALVIWGLSATLGNLSHAQEVLLAGHPGRLVQGKLAKDLLVDTLLPKRGVERFSWAGHLGVRMVPHVANEIEHSATTLIFTNTRAQAEIWYQALLEARPEWAGLIALHHGSLDREVRDWVELGLKEGKLRAVVCTSSLDLGVDFLPVERVLQVGSPKGVARLLQRAGRSGHAPGRPSRVTLVPTHSLELVEAAAAQKAVAARRIESRSAPPKPLDVLVQHLVTIALGGGFTPQTLLEEVRTAWAYRELTDEEWAWSLAFVRHGGHSLTAYPDYRRVEPDEQGIWRVPDRQLARRHRMGIGTIVSESALHVQFWTKGGGGGRLGSIEEGFIARLKPGDHFLFAGRVLELVRVENMTVYVRRASSKKAAIPRWSGMRMPLSDEMAEAVIDELTEADQERFTTPEMQLVKPLLDIQKHWSALPTRNHLLGETMKSREGWHLFLYPFAGRHAHLGLASLLAWRIGQRRPISFSIAINDYGFELLSPSKVNWEEELDGQLFSTQTLLADVIASLNASELAQRRFREIARISGLIFTGYPGAQKSTRQLQASSSLFFQVFQQYDPQNLLLTQAEQEVLRQELDVRRLEKALERMQALELNLHAIERPTPFSFPLLVERYRESMSSEKLADRIARMVQDLENAAGPGDYDLPTEGNDLMALGAGESDLPARRKGRAPRQVKTGLPSTKRQKRG